MMKLAAQGLDGALCNIGTGIDALAVAEARKIVDSQIASANEGTRNLT